MQQLVQPDLTATGSIGWCLQYAARVFHCTGTSPYAWTAWEATQFKHTDQIPIDVAVPCWFSFMVGPVDEGHVVVSVPGKGFYSSPWKQGTDHAVLPSIAEIERIYGAKYVGWSEDILGLRVAQGGNQVWLDQSVINDYEAWKRTGQTLSFDPAYPAMGGTPGKPLTGDTSGITTVLNDFRANKVANQDAQPYKQFVAVDNAAVWQSVNGDLTKLVVEPKNGGSIPVATELKPGLYKVV